MIQIEGLRKRFGATTVLDGVDLEIPPLQRVAIVGSNGAGKTTLFRCLLGQYRFEGKLAVNGLTHARHRTAILSRIAFVPQLPPPLRMPVGEFIRYVARVSGAAASRIEDIAAQLGLDIAEIHGRAFVKLSGGQKHKLLVAAALGRDVDLLILDEPAANFDPAARAVLFELMARRHTTMIISSHRLDEIAALVNRVVELDRGKVALDDRVAEAMGLDRRLGCRIHLGHAEPAFAKAAREWGLADVDSGAAWEGAIPAPDRLRFFGFLARYSGLVTAVRMEEDDAR